MSGQRAAFIDRDGVINQLVADPRTGHSESPLRIEDVALIPGAARALRDLEDAGVTRVGVSNQPAAAKGSIARSELDAIQARVLALLGAEGASFDNFRICPHHPSGVIPELTGPCACRKPAPGMLLDAARELGIDLASSWMIGDTDTDVQAGRAAGCHTVLIEHRPSAHKRTATTRPDAVVADLGGAVTFLLAHDGVN